MPSVSTLVHKCVKYCFHGTVVILLATSLAAAQEPQRKQVKTQYFPVGGLSTEPWSDQFRTKWYSAQLKALQEPSLWEASKTQKTQSYRFLWLRTFDHPIAVRIELMPDGTSRLTTKMGSGAGGYKPGRLVKNDTRVLARERTNWFLRMVEEHNFWALQSHEDAGGNDGAQWILEGIKDGKYHLVDQWTPKTGDIRDIGLVMLDSLARINVDSREIY